MDVCILIVVQFTFLTMGESLRYRIKGQDEYRSDEAEIRVDKSVCGQTFQLSYRSRKQIVFIYNDDPLNNYCDIHVRRRVLNSGNCVLRHDDFNSTIQSDTCGLFRSGICVALSHSSNISTNYNKLDCLKDFYFYFGDDRSKHISKAYRCPDTQQKRCVLHPDLHLVFNHSRPTTANISFQVIVSLPDHKRLRTARSSNTSWAAWSTWVARNPIDTSDSWSLWATEHSTDLSDYWSSWKSDNSWSSGDGWPSRDGWSSWDGWSPSGTKYSYTKTGTIIGIVVTVIVAIVIICYYCFRHKIGRQEDRQLDPALRELRGEESQPMTSLPRMTTATQPVVTSFDTSVTPSYTTVTPSYTTVTPSYTTVTPSYTTVTPSCTTVTPSYTTVTSSCTTVTPSYTTVTPSYTTVTPSYTTVTPSCTTVTPPYTTVTPSYTTVMPSYSPHSANQTTDTTVNNSYRYPPFPSAPPPSNSNQADTCSPPPLYDSIFPDK